MECVVSGIADALIQKEREGCAPLSLAFLAHGQGKEGEDDETGLSQRMDWGSLVTGPYHLKRQPSGRVFSK